MQPESCWKETGEQFTGKCSLSFQIHERTCEQMGGQVNGQAGWTARLRGKQMVGVSFM